MAIYRRPKPRWPALLGALVLGLVVGFGVGLTLGRQEPDPADAVQEVKSSLSRAASTLEIVEIEYEESVEDGRVVSDAEYSGAQDALARSRSSYEEVQGALAALDSQRTMAIDSAYDDLESMVAERAEASEVEAAVDELAEMLQGP